MSYGPGFFQLGEQVARLADKILQGTAPADLPVETADFFLSINLQTAQAIGLDISDDVLQQADTIIR
jgi:putative ABC transport system substrate-binding protein